MVRVRRANKIDLKVPVLLARYSGENKITEEDVARRLEGHEVHAITAEGASICLWGEGSKKGKKMAVA